MLSFLSSLGVERLPVAEPEALASDVLLALRLLPGTLSDGRQGTAICLVLDMRTVVEFERG
jgi:hypothetical protein